MRECKLYIYPGYYIHILRSQCRRATAIRKALSSSFLSSSKNFLLTQKCKRRRTKRVKGIFSGYYHDHSEDYAAKWSAARRVESVPQESPPSREKSSFCNLRPYNVLRAVRLACHSSLISRDARVNAAIQISVIPCQLAEETSWADVRKVYDVVNINESSVRRVSC